MHHLIGQTSTGELMLTYWGLGLVCWLSILTVGLGVLLYRGATRYGPVGYMGATGIRGLDGETTIVYVHTSVGSSPCELTEEQRITLHYLTELAELAESDSPGD
jgi:hypothetical protein